MNPIPWLALAVVASIAIRGQAPPTTVPATARALKPAPVQPLPYSHKTHVALGLECRTCHLNPEGGRLMTYPSPTFCMSCHQAIATDRPAIKKLAGHAAAGTEVPWVRVYAVHDYVFWSHGPHLAAKVECVECHGPVGEREVVAEETDVVTMLGCQRCHDRRQVFTDCGDCHEPRQ
jgi:hypothetical protein